MGTYQTALYKVQGGNELVVASGGAITVEAGGSVSYAASANLALTGTITMTAAAQIKQGTSSTALTDATVGAGPIQLFVNPTITNGARYTTVRVESLLAGTDTFTTQGSGLYTIRGLAGVATGKTFKGSANQGYVAGVQGKLQISGTLGDNNSGGIYSAAVIAQIATAGGAFGSDAQVYGLWVDNQSGGVALPTLSHMVNITNNGGAVTNFFKLYGNNAVAQFMNVDTCGGALETTFTGNASKQVRALKVVVDGVQYYLPLQNATS